MKISDLSQINEDLILSILIPTRNRAHCIEKSVRIIIKAINYAGQTSRVELVIANNCSSDNTREVVKSLMMGCDFIKYYEHEKSYPSAEESMAYAIKYCKGKYVWTFGDDDYMRYDAVERVLKVLKLNKYDLLIQNINWIKCDDFEKKKFSYIEFTDSNVEAVEYANGRIFKDFGFWHITTSFASICFNKEKFKLDFFLKAISVSKIYSYPIALLASFNHGLSLFLVKPTVIMTENTIEDEFKRMSKLNVSGGLLPRYSWSTGFIRLLKLLSTEIKTDLASLLLFREVSLCRVKYSQHQSFVIENISSNFLLDLSKLKLHDFFTKHKMIKDALSDYLAAVDLMRNRYITYEIIYKKISRLRRLFSFGRVAMIFVVFLKYKKIKRNIKSVRVIDHGNMLSEFRDGSKTPIQLKNSIYLVKGKPIISI